MKIEIDSHTLLRAQERGASESEIRQVIEDGVPIPVRKNRLGKAQVFPFGQIWNGRYYEEKRVEVVYRVGGGRATTITVYVFYGKWEIENENRIPG